MKEEVLKNQFKQSTDPAQRTTYIHMFVCILYIYIWFSRSFDFLTAYFVVGYFGEAISSLHNWGPTN